MPGAAMNADGNLLFSTMLSFTPTPVIVGANTTAEQTFTIPGLQVGDFVNIIKPSTQAGLGIVNCRVSAANTLAVAFCNTTGGGLTPTALERYLLMVDRFDGANVQNPPSAFV